MSASIGKTLDKLLSGEITKQEAVTILQKQRSKLVKKATL